MFNQSKWKIWYNNLPEHTKIWLNSQPLYFERDLIKVAILSGCIGIIIGLMI